MKKSITGVMMYYYKICHRKLWYFCHEIQMEQGNENVWIGKILDEESYKKDEKHINIDNVINIDFIRSSGVLHEVKKSKKIEEASIFQIKYYLYYLQRKNVRGIKGRLDYPLLKQIVEVELADSDIIEIENALLEIEKINDMENPPRLKKKNICKSCAYFDLCYI